MRFKHQGDYQAMVALEDSAMKRIDELISRSLPDDSIKEPFLAWRNRAAALREADKQGVIEFWPKVDGLSADERSVAFGKFWQERMKNWSELRDTDRAGLGML